MMARVPDEAIPILRVEDLDRSLPWYVNLGYVEEWTHPSTVSDAPRFSSIARQGGCRLFLSEHRGDGRPESVIYLRVSDINELAAALGMEVEDVDGRRELHLRDPDDNRIRVGVTPG
jgi:catechol 2,3-dioxygenase-like lactoylglutathione lyase family enzyme